MSWVSLLDDPLTWVGGYLAVGVGLTASDVVGTDEEHLALLRDVPVPRWFLVTVAVILLLVFTVAWPLPAAGRTWSWARDRFGSDEDEIEDEENE